MPPSRESSERPADKEKQDRVKAADKSRNSTEKDKKVKKDAEKPSSSGSTFTKDGQSTSKVRSSERKAEQNIATGSTNCPARQPQDGGAHDQNNAALTDKIDQLFSLVGGLAQSVKTLQSDKNPRKRTHEMSDRSDGEITGEDDRFDSDTDNDAEGSDSDFDNCDRRDDRSPPRLEHYDPLAHTFGKGKASSASKTIDKAVEGLASFFQSNKEVTGDNIDAELAVALNEGLRLRPLDASVNELLDSYHYPANVPNLKVPKTNPDISSDLWKGSQLLDLLLQKCQLITSKALVPILRLLDNDSVERKFPVHHDEVHHSLRLLAASFNFLSQARKEVIRNNFRDSHISKLCTWDTPVGTEQLFDFDVVAKVDTMTKTKSLKATIRKKRKTSSDYSRRHSVHSGKRLYHSYRSQPRYEQSYSSGYRSYRSNSNSNGQSSKKPFLGKGKRQQKGKDRQ